MRILRLLLVGLCLGGAACSSVYVGKSFYYPPGAKPTQVARGGGYVSFDDSGIPYRVFVGAAGAPGKGYGELSRKHPQVEFYKDGVRKGRKLEYAFTAEGLVYDLVWHAPGDCTLIFYNLPRGTDESDKGAQALRREIARQRFRYDPKADEFREVS